MFVIDCVNCGECFESVTPDAFCEQACREAFYAKPEDERMTVVVTTCPTCKEIFSRQMSRDMIRNWIFCEMCPGCASLPLTIQLTKRYQ